MDVEGLLRSVIRFSNFMTARLIVSGAVFYVISGFTDIGSSTEGILPNLDLMSNVIQNYQNIFDILGVSDFALLLIFFLFLTAIQLTYVLFERIGGYIPPAIIPLPGWTAIDDLTNSTFNVLRAARGTDHSEAENQRLFEFRRKLEAINKANEAQYEEQLAVTYAAFDISKSLSLFALGAWIYALFGQKYTGDPIFLLIIVSLCLLTAAYTTLSIFRTHHARIEELRSEVSQQLLGFADIWLSAKHQKKVRAACVPTPGLTAASFEVLMPVYGTLDDLLTETKKWRAGTNPATAPTPPIVLVEASNADRPAPKSKAK